MQSNLDVFLNAEQAGTLWCSWSGPICNQTIKLPAGPRLKTLLENGASTGDRVWNVIHTKSGSLLSMKSSLNSVYLELENSARIPLVKPRSKVTFGRIDMTQNQIFAYFGEENGSIHVFQVSEKGDAVLIARCQSEFRSPVQHLLHQPVARSRRDPAAFHLWVLSDNHISLISGIPPTVSSDAPNSAVCIELSRTATFNPESSSAALLRLQLLDTAGCGPSSLLAAHFLSAAGVVQVYLVDAAATVLNALQVHSGHAQPSSVPQSLHAVVAVPFESAPASSLSSAASHGGITTLFSFGRPDSSAQQERAVASIIEPSSVRTVGRSFGGDSSSSHGALSQPPAASFVLRIVGSEGTEIAATYRSAQQRVLDALVEVGSAVFSRAHTELATSSSAAAGGQPLLDAQLLRTIFKSDGTIHSHKEVEVGLTTTTTTRQTSSGEPGPELLWRACLRLHLVPQWRSAAILGAVAALDATADSSSSATKYFSVSRMVLMEAALAGGLGHLVAQYVVARTEGQAGDFLLADVKRVYEWAVGASSPMGSSQVPSVQSALEAFVRASCKGDLVLAMLSPSTCRSSSSVEAGLQAAVDVTSGLRLVVEALLERKQHALEGEDSPDRIVVQVAEEGQLALRVQIQELICLNQITSTLLEVSRSAGLSFCALLPGEVHDLQRGHLRTSSSSSAAAASMLSEYHFAVSDRLRAFPELRFLPEYLRAGDARLFDELCALLDDNSARAANFLRVGGESALGVNLNHLAESITDLLLVPLLALRTELARFSSTLPHAHRSPSHLEEAEAAVTSKTQVGHSVVLYFLAEMAHLSVPALQSGLRANSLPAVRSLVRKVGAAAGLTHAVSTGVLALWQVDAGVAVAEAVRLVGSSDTSIAQDQNILAATLRRLLSSNHLAEAASLLNYLRVSKHAVVQTKFFIMATAAAVARTDMWQFSWHSAKALSAAQYGERSAEHVLVKRELVHMLLQWALSRDEVGRLLDSVLDSEEQNEVELVLRGLATSELERHSASAPAVDLCVAFLVRRARFADAIEIHERHAALVSAARFNTPGSQELNELAQSVEVRRTLIDAHASIPTIPVANFYL